MHSLSSTDPISLFTTWLKEAQRQEINDPNAVALATADDRGLPSVRMVLLKEVDSRGFVFFTNLKSHKSKDLYANPQAALCFHWKTIRRQVRVQGDVEQVSEEKADSYFKTRERMSQIGAWASHQSQPVSDPDQLARRVTFYSEKFSQADVPRPPYWGGFRIIPQQIEFWQDRSFRLHERLLYEKCTTDPPTWVIINLFP